jgi:saccharopine dehydrogenase-like NADP-dependent oxidoreductase
MKRVLVLGSGLVARPLVRYLLDRGYQVVVGTLLLERAEEMIAGHPNGKAFLLDVQQDEAQLASFIESCDLAVSLLPFSFHPMVARLCISRRKHMVTTSYVAPAMWDLDGEARTAEVTVLNEIGVDPGIDHMSAMRIIDDARQRGGRVVAFRSYCGGLPAPEANDNPFGYKFSWAPRGVLLAGRNSARYLLDGHRIDVPPHRLFRDMHLLAVEGLGDFEAYPNRDSINYIDIYGLSGIKTMFRGTLRNMGWCDCLFNIGKLGLLSLDEVTVAGKTYAEFMSDLVGRGPAEELRSATAARLGLPRHALPILNLEWLGMFSDRTFQFDRIAPLDALGELMLEKLAFQPGERDMIVLYHDFRIEFSDGRKEHTVSQLFDFGVPYGDSSMSRTVSLPAAIAVDLILTGKIQARGVLRPILPEIYGPVLDELAALNIACHERTEAFWL